MAYRNDYEEERRYPINPITGIPGGIGNPTTYYDPNAPGNARDMEAKANYGRAIARGRTPPSASFLDLKARSLANPHRNETFNLTNYGPVSSSSGGLGSNPSIAQQVLAQVLPEASQFPPAGALGGPLGLAASNGTTQPARSLSEIAGGTNHAQEWMGKVPTIAPPILNQGKSSAFPGVNQSNFKYLPPSNIPTTRPRTAQADDDTIGNDPFRKAFGGGLPTPSPTPSPSRFARFDFRSGIRNSLRTPAYEDDDEIVKFRFGSGLLS